MMVTLAFAVIGHVIVGVVEFYSTYAMNIIHMTTTLLPNSQSRSGVNCH